MYLNRCILEKFQLVRCLFQSYSQRITLGVFEVSLFLLSLLLLFFYFYLLFFFFGLIFKIHVSQYEESAFRQYCNPVLDLNRTIKSSAYKSEFISVLFGRKNGSDIVFSNKYGKFFI